MNGTADECVRGQERGIRRACIGDVSIVLIAGADAPDFGVRHNIGRRGLGTACGCIAARRAAYLLGNRPV